jgi:hypothetical protein
MRIEEQGKIKGTAAADTHLTAAGAAIVGCGDFGHASSG